MPKPRVIEQPSTTQHFTLGIDAMADLLAPTLGPVGGVVANQRDFQGKPELLDDSATTMRRILNLGDPRADVGAMLMRSMVWRVVQRAGDGGATAAVLTRAFYTEAVRLIAGGANAMRLAKGVDLGVAAAVKALHAQAQPVRHPNDLANVALTVIRDPALAAVLGEMSYLLGADAHVTVEKYVAPYLQQFYYAGANLKAQIASMYLYTNPEHKSAVAINGALALVDGNLKDPADAVSLIQAASEIGAQSLTIIGGNFSDAVIGVLVANSRQGEINHDTKKNGKGESKKPVIIAAKPKDVGDARRAVFDDLAALTGAEVLGRAWSRSPSQAQASDLGRIQRSEVTLEHMLLLPENQLTPDARQRSADLQSRLAKMTLDDEERPLVVQRLAMLNGGMGLLKIGTESKLDREVRAQNAERALRVLSVAQHTGVVPGGGAALLHCVSALDEIDAAEDVRFGVKLVQHAMVAPIRQILDNAHVTSSSVIIDRILRAGPGVTYDVMTEQIGDAHEMGVLDVAGVLATVIRTAASAAMMALTTDTIVYHKNPQQAMNP